MMSEEQQVKELINSSKNILITVKKFYNSDDIGTALAWLLLLKKLNKQVSLVVDDFNLPAELKFLPEVESIKGNLNYLKKHTITVDLARTELEELSYDLKDKSLEIYLTPKKGEINKDDLSLKEKNYKYNLILTVGTPELESLGQIFDDNPDFFYKIPIINIDCQGENDRYGQINYVDLNRSSVAEISFEIFKNFNHDLIDENIATCLLTGLITATDSFKNTHLNPETLTFASQLINKGAAKEKIISNLYHNKSVSTLKTWGKVLSNLKSDDKNKIIWSAIKSSELKNPVFNENDFISLLKELLNTVGRVNLLALFIESEQKTKVFLYKNNQNLNLIPLIRKYQGEGNKKLSTFFINKGLEASEKELLEELNKYFSVID